MYASVVTSLLMAVAVLAQDAPRIETPMGVVQCQPSRLMWSGGTPPYWITVIPAGQPGAAPIMTLKDSTQDTSMTWNVNLAPNTQITLQIRDGNGNVQFSSPITIQAGSNTACMTAAATGTDSAGAEAGASGGPTNSAPASGSAAASSPAAAGSASASSPAASASSPAANPSATAQPTTSPGAVASASATSAAASVSSAVSSASAPTSSTAAASAMNVPVVGAAAVAAAIMAYV